MSWFFFLLNILKFCLLTLNFFFLLGSGGPPNDRSGDFIVQEDTIFVSGMSPNTSEADIEQHFGSIGIIKVINILSKDFSYLYNDPLKFFNIFFSD